MKKEEDRMNVQLDQDISRRWLRNVLLDNLGGDGARAIIDSGLVFLRNSLAHGEQ